MSAFATGSSIRYFYSRHVDGIVGDSNHDGKDHRRNPVHPRWTKRGPRETKQTKRLEWRKEEQKPETSFRKQLVRIASANLALVEEARDEDGVSQQVTNADWQESKADLDRSKVPLSIDEFERFEEDEDEHVGETREEGEAEDDGFPEEHLEWA